MTDTRRPSISVARRSPVQSVATVIALGFLVVGVAGFAPGITTHYGDLSLAGHHSGAQLLGLFEVSVLHNVVHLLFGVVGYLAARSSPPHARAYLVAGGAIYLVLWFYGLVIDEGSRANVVPLDRADDWLHLGLGVLMVGSGLLLRLRPLHR